MEFPTIYNSLIIRIQSLKSFMILVLLSINEMNKYISILNYLQYTFKLPVCQKILIKQSN